MLSFICDQFNSNSWPCVELWHIWYRVDSVRYRGWGVEESHSGTAWHHTKLWWITGLCSASDWSHRVLSSQSDVKINVVGADRLFHWGRGTERREQAILPRICGNRQKPQSCCCTGRRCSGAHTTYCSTGTWDSFRAGRAVATSPG